jgi:hypothetical protein
VAAATDRHSPCCAITHAPDSNSSKPANPTPPDGRFVPMLAHVHAPSWVHNCLVFQDVRSCRSRSAAQQENTSQYHGVRKTARPHAGRMRREASAGARRTSQPGRCSAATAVPAVHMAHDIQTVVYTPLQRRCRAKLIRMYLLFVDAQLVQRSEVAPFCCSAAAVSQRKTMRGLSAA